MIYDLRLVMTSRYEASVPFARHVLRLSPSTRPGQTVIASSLRASPEPSGFQESEDFFGNRMAFVSYDKPHQELVMRLNARVSLDPDMQTNLLDSAPWELVAAEAAGGHDLSPLSPAHFLFPSRRVRLSGSITDYAARSFLPGAPVVSCAADLMRRIHDGFTYVPGATDASTPPEQVFSTRRGVCQDFAHVMIAGLRGLGLPAAYVSGLLRTLPPPGAQRLEGSDATHAWVMVWCGGHVGWVGFDPTNAMLTGEDHVVIAIGRDYADIAPIDGVIVTFGAQQIDTVVDVTPVPPLQA